MKVLGIVCSPRLHGNTEIMVQESLAEAQQAGAEVELFTLAGKTIAPCDGCLSCQRTKECHIKDDMQDVYIKLLEADGIIFGTPVYFATVSAQAKALIDRSLIFLEEYKLRNKVAGAVMTADRTGVTSALAVFSIFFNLHRMIMAGAAFGFSGSKKGGIRNDKTGMAQAKALGRAVVRRIHCYKIPSHIALSTSSQENYI